jgi:enoyl-[acyl-carrier protein] reductase II
MSPRVGLIVDVPHSAEGMRSEPAVSVPVAAGTWLDASAAPEPPLEPPAERSSDQGLPTWSVVPPRPGVAVPVGHLVEHPARGGERLPGDGVKVFQADRDPAELRSSSPVPAEVVQMINTRERARPRNLRGPSGIRRLPGMGFENRVTRALGVDVPIVQAPMGWIARAPLASAVSNAGAFGIIETSSGELDVVREEIRKMRDLTDKPFGVNIAQAFVRDPNIVEFVADQGVKFVTTSAGSPMRYTAALKERGLTVFHVVPDLAGALKAVDAGVDGLVVEGGEGGGFKSPTPVSTMVLLPLIASKVDVPIIAAGGFVDGPTMAAAFALGAEGIQMGTRMVSAAESPIHDNWKQAVLAARETDTVFLNRHTKPALRALRTERTTALEFDTESNAMALFGRAMDLYFGGDMEAAIALSGQVAGRIDAIEPVADIIRRTATDCLAILQDLAKRYPLHP